MKAFFIAIAAAAMTLSASHGVAGGNPELGKQKSQVCAACHGPDGNGSNPMYPRLAGQYASYLTKSLKDYRSGARKNPIMAGFAAPLTDEDIANLAAYFSSQSGSLAVPGH